MNGEEIRHEHESELGYSGASVAHYHVPFPSGKVPKVTHEWTGPEPTSIYYPDIDGKPDSRGLCAKPHFISKAMDDALVKADRAEARVAELEAEIRKLLDFGQTQRLGLRRAIMRHGRSLGLERARVAELEAGIRGVMSDIRVRSHHGADAPLLIANALERLLERGEG